MPCPLYDGKRRVGNEPVEVEHNGRTYLFQWTAESGWFPVYANGNKRSAVIPGAVWDIVYRLPWPGRE